MATSENIGPVKKLEVILENNHKCVYYPNQVVEGHVTLEVAEHMSSRGLYLNFCGCGSLHWTEVRTGRFHRCVDTVRFESSEEYFRIQERLQEEMLLAPGVSTFPFKFQLPSKLPENYRDNICHIEYFLDAWMKMDNDHRNDFHDKKPLTILNPLDLNKLIIPDVTVPIQRQQSETVRYTLCSFGTIRCHFRVERSGYSAGEMMILGADVDNGTHRTIKHAFVRFVQETLYITEEKTQQYTANLGSVNLGSIGPRRTETWNDVPLVFPARHALFNLAPSHIITVRYVLELVIAPQWMKKPIVLPLQLMVGAIKLKRRTKSMMPLDRLNSTALSKRLTPIVDFIPVRSQRDAPRGSTDITESPRDAKETDTPRARDPNETDTPRSRDPQQTDTPLSRDAKETETPRSRDAPQTDLFRSHDAREPEISRLRDDKQTDLTQSPNDMKADDQQNRVTNDTNQLQDGKPAHQRKKYRHKRVAPSDVTDTRNYITEIVEMREREKSFTRNNEESAIH